MTDTALDPRPAPADAGYDIEFFWDPVCPFAWITSRWIEKVAAQTDYNVDWRFISLRILNKDKDYATEFPPHYEDGHNSGLYMLRVAAKVRADEGRPAMGALYQAFGEGYFDQDPNEHTRDDLRSKVGSTEFIVAALEKAGLSGDYAAAADDASLDEEIEAETELALSRTGRNVGTPIISFNPPDGLSFFGPVISRVPSDEEAVPLWNAVTTLASFEGFAEIKRSMRERPQLRIMGEPQAEPVLEDWKDGHVDGALASDVAGALASDVAGAE